MVLPPQRQAFTTKLTLLQDNQMVVFRCGIIDKTVMYKAAWQKCSRDWFVWVLYAGRRFVAAAKGAF